MLSQRELITSDFVGSSPTYSWEFAGVARITSLLPVLPVASGGACDHASALSILSNIAEPCLFGVRY